MNGLFCCVDLQLVIGWGNQESFNACERGNKMCNRTCEHLPHPDGPCDRPANPIEEIKRSLKVEGEDDSIGPNFTPPKKLQAVKFNGNANE